MIACRLLLASLGLVVGATAGASELCRPDGSANLGFKPVKSDYFKPSSLTVGLHSPQQLNIDFDAINRRLEALGSDRLDPGHAFPAQLQGLSTHTPPRLHAAPPQLRLSIIPGRFDGTLRVIHLPPAGPEGDKRRLVPLTTAQERDLSACERAIELAQRLTGDTNPSEVTPTEACQRLRFDRDCLTNTELPAAFEDPRSWRGALIGLTTAAGQPNCMGTLTHDGSGFRLITARHCFIDRGTGRVSATDKLRTGKAFDGKRQITLKDEDVARLELPCASPCPLPAGAYGPERDAISLPVSVVELPGALALPEVRMDPTIKGCITPSGEDRNAECTRVVVAGAISDLLAARRVESQATGVAVSGSWVDEVRWPKWFGGYTRLNYLEEHCAYYTSQTVSGFSGAPLMTRTTRENNHPVLYIAGVHSGASSANEKAWPPCKTELGHPADQRLNLNIADTEVDKP